jgi:hypothetical protein
VGPDGRCARRPGTTIGPPTRVRRGNLCAAVEGADARRAAAPGAVEQAAAGRMRWLWEEGGLPRLAAGHENVGPAGEWKSG